MDHEREEIERLRSKYGTINNLEKELEELSKKYSDGEITWDDYYCTGNDLAQEISFWKTYDYL